MRLTNTTDFPNHFLRRMVSWCCKQLDLPVRDVKAANFANSRSAWGGRAYLRQRRISTRIGKASDFPATARQPGSKVTETIADRLECLVKVTAHELAHLDNYKHGSTTRLRGGHGGGEGRTQAMAFAVLRAFREQREQLVAEWSAEPKQREIKTKLSRQEQNAQRAAKNLAAWERKMKLAKTKVSKYRKQVRYYERVAATRAD